MGLTKIQIAERRAYWDLLDDDVKERLGKCGIGRDSYRGVLHHRRTRRSRRADGR